MLAPKILTHVVDALARFLQEYKIKPRFQLPLNSDGSVIDVSVLSGLLASFVNEVQNLENGLYDIEGGSQLFDGTSYRAVGAQLDGIGAIVGIQRANMDDGEYLLFILAKIAENFSNATTAEIEHIASLLFQVSSLIFLPLYPASIAIEIPDTSPLDPAFYPAVAGIIKSSLAAGVGLGFLALTPPVMFQFGNVGGPMIGGGFGDGTPGTGGGFAGDIYNDPGA